MSCAWWCLTFTVAVTTHCFLTVNGTVSKQATYQNIQIKIRAHFEKFCDEIATKRGDKKIELIHNGDSLTATTTKAGMYAL